MAPASIQDIEFSKNASQRKKQKVVKSTKSSHIPEPLEAELDTFYKALNEVKTKSAILKITPPYAAAFVVEDSSHPKAIADYYDPKTLELPYHELLQECDKVFATLKVYQCVCVSPNGQYKMCVTVNVGDPRGSRLRRKGNYWTVWQ